MRVERSVVSVSWIPSEAVPGIPKVAFMAGALQYDDPPPEQLPELEDLQRAGAFRFANELRAWVEVEDSTITGCGYAGRGYVSRTKIRVGPGAVPFKGVSYPELRSSPQMADSSVRFVQTTGGRTGAPLPSLPRRGRPLFAVMPPAVWTTLALTIHADGTCEHEIVGASPFPRHWIYGDDRTVTQKVAVADFATWMGSVFGKRTPWGGHELAALMTEAETALERRLSRRLMGGGKPVLRRVQEGEELTTQHEAAAEVFLILNGLFDVEVDGQRVGQVGPGMIVGERAHLGAGRRTATVRAVTEATVAVTSADQFELEDLERVATTHRREGG
jgi:hypothetical protein